MGNHRLRVVLFHADRLHAIEAYRRFIHAESGRSTSSPLTERNPNDRRILGSDQFAGRVLGQSWKPKSRKSLEEIIAEACSTFSVTVEQLRSHSRRHLLVKARAWVAHQAITGRVVSVATVARAFNRDESSLRRALKTHFNFP